MQNPNNQNKTHGKISSSLKCKASKRVVVSRSFLDALVSNKRSSANNSTGKNQDNYTFVVIANKDKEVELAKPSEVKPSVFGAIKTLIITICSKVVKPLCIFIYRTMVSFLIATITMLTNFINRKTSKEATSKPTSKITSNINKEITSENTSNTLSEPTSTATTISETLNHENVLTFRTKKTRSKRS